MGRVLVDPLISNLGCQSIIPSDISEDAKAVRDKMNVKGKRFEKISVKRSKETTKTSLVNLLEILSLPGCITSNPPNDYVSKPAVLRLELLKAQLLWRLNRGRPYLPTCASWQPQFFYYLAVGRLMSCLKCRWSLLEVTCLCPQSPEQNLKQSCIQLDTSMSSHTF